MELIDILKYAAGQKFSAIRISPDAPLEFIQDGKIFYNSDWPEKVTATECQRLFFSVLYDEQRQELASAGSVEVAFGVSGVAKFLMKARTDDGSVSGLIHILESAS